MPLTKQEKQTILSDLREKMDKQKSLVFADFTGLKVKDLSSLRKKMKDKECELKVAKKTLISLLLKEKKLEGDVKKMKGEILLGFGYKDEVMPFKVIYDFAKDKENLKILAGFIGQNLYAKEKALEIAQLPSGQELMSKLVYVIKSPLSGFHNVLQGNLRKLVYILSKIEKVGN